jgi:hypothetical protein
MIFHPAYRAVAGQSCPWITEEPCRALGVLIGPARPGDPGGYDGHSSTRLTKLESPGPSSFAQRYEEETRSLPDRST